MFSLCISDEAAEDLRGLLKTVPEAGRVIAALLQQAKSSQELLDIFSVQGYGAYESGDFHVTQLFVHQQAGRNIWRIKDWRLERIRLQYRVVYAFDGFSRRYHVLAICHRNEIDYNNDANPRTKRIVAAYNRLAIRSIAPRR